MKVTIRPLPNGQQIIDLPPYISPAEMAYLRSVMPKRVHAHKAVGPTVIDIPDMTGRYTPSVFQRRKSR